MSYFGIGYPVFQLRESDGITVYEEYSLPYPTWRLFKPILVNDPEMNPISHKLLERRFGWHLEFTFHWDLVAAEADVAKIIRIASETVKQVWLYPHHELTAIAYEVIFLDLELPLLAGKNAYQGAEIKVQTAELQAEMDEKFSLFVCSAPLNRGEANLA